MNAKLDLFTRIRNDEFKNKNPLFNRAAYNAESARLEGLFKAALFEEYGVTGHPKADKCYSLAWEHGHSAGFSEVANYFSEFVELIK
jgi:hypothetical protein